MKIVPVILAGGNGKRFWPMSRENRPKQVLPILSDNPLIEDCVNRFADYESVYIVSNKKLYYKYYKSLLPAKVSYVFEPASRNTAPAIALTAYSIQQAHGDCLIAIDTSDHYYENEEHYNEVLTNGANYAEMFNKIVLIGTEALTPHTGYGYLQVAKDSTGDLAKNVYTVKKFIEKPNLKTAQKFMDGKQHFWNTSIIITKCSVLLSEYAKFMPDMLDQIKKLDKIPNPAKVFRKFPNISISRGIFEKSKELAMLKSALVWVDVGDFNALLDIYPLDVNQNHSNSNLFAFNSEHNLINSIKPVVLIGVKNLVVIEKNDVILICHQNATQEIKTYLPQIQPTLL